VRSFWPLQAVLPGNISISVVDKPKREEKIQISGYKVLIPEAYSSKGL
jgi:hypothetical protein